MRRSCAPAGVALLVLLLPAAAQRADWSSLGAGNSIPANAEIRVKTTDGREHRGRFQSVSDTALAVQTRNGAEELARPSVSRVSVKRKGHRLRHAMIGLAIGAGAGLGAGAGIDAGSSCKNSFGPCFPNAGKAILTPLGALLGLGVGALLPSGGWDEVYRAP